MRTKERTKLARLPNQEAKRIPGFWDSRLAPFLEKRAAILVACLVLIGAGRIAATYNALSITFDEPIHLACGMEYLSKHVYRYETQHPPLERVMGALGPYLSGMRTIGKPTATEEAAALLPPVSGTNRTLMLMRLGILPIFVVAVLALFLATRRWFGKPASVLATAVFSMIPTVLAHAGLATTDIALTAFLGAAFFSLLAWAESPTLNRALLLGLWTGLSVLSKFTTLIYLPAGAVLAVIFYILARRPAMVQLAALGRERLPGFGIAIGAGALVIWTGYLFSFGRVAGWSFSLPAPEFFEGVRAVLEHNAGGHNAYLLGQRSMTGWWYFFPVALSVKTPLPVLLLIVPGVVACFHQRRRYGLMPVAFALGALLPAMAGQINIGVRHVLPVYLSFSMIAALGMVQVFRWLKSPILAVAIAGGMLFWLAAGGIRQHPDYLAYFNEFASAHPEDILADSDLDWGQELKQVGRRLQQVGAKDVSLYIVENDYATPEYLQKLAGFPPVRPFQMIDPGEGWNVVSPTRAGIFQGGVRHDVPVGKRQEGLFRQANPPWFSTLAPTERVGALLLYHIPPGFRMQ